MSINTAFSADYKFWGDGVATSVVFDLLNTPSESSGSINNQIPKQPIDVQTFDGDVSSISISGTEVTVNFSSPFSGLHITTLYVLF